DSVHPTLVGHELIARRVLVASLPVLGLPDGREAWLDDFARSLGAPLPAPDQVLRGAGAPPRFAELLALYEGDGVDARLRDDDTDLPDCVREWDPLLGRACTARSLLAARSEPRRREITDT